MSTGDDGHEALRDKLRIWTIASSVFGMLGLLTICVCISACYFTSKRARQRRERIHGVGILPQPIIIGQLRGQRRSTAANPSRRESNQAPPSNQVTVGPPTPRSSIPTQSAV